MAQMENFDPVTVTFRSGEWVELLRQVVYAATACERFLDDLNRSTDPKRDVYVRTSADRVVHAMRAMDYAAELLHEAHARPVPKG